MIGLCYYAYVPALRTRTKYHIMLQSTRYLRCHCVRAQTLDGTRTKYLMHTQSNKFQSDVEAKHPLDN